MNKYFQSTGRFAIYFERNILSAHCQLQVVPVPKRMINRLEDSFKVIIYIIRNYIILLSLKKNEFYIIIIIIHRALLKNMISNW